MVVLEESPADIMARRAIDVFHNSVIGSQVTSNTTLPNSPARNNAHIISTWDGLDDMDVDKALVCSTVLPVVSLSCCEWSEVRFCD
jgi:hypothetical protein